MNDGDAMTGAEPPAKATRREWLGLAVIALPCVLYAMDLTVLNLALPRIAGDLKPSSADLLWIVDIYGFFVAGLLVTMGNLGDRIGRRHRPDPVAGVSIHDGEVPGPRERRAVTGRRAVGDLRPQGMGAGRLQLGAAALGRYRDRCRRAVRASPASAPRSAH